MIESNGKPRARRRHKDSDEETAEAIASGVLPRRAYRKGEAAAMLGVSRWTVDRLIASGELGSVRLDTASKTTADARRLVLVPVEELDRFIARRTTRTPA